MAIVKCERLHCAHNNKKGKCLKKSINIDFGGCDSYEKGFTHYFNCVWNMMKSGNLLMYPDLNEDSRIGLFYVLECFDLKVCERGHGLWKFMTLHKNEEDSPSLTLDEILAMDINREKLAYHNEKFNQGILPPYEKIEKPEIKVKSQPYGYLSPDGIFSEGEWGTHEELAWEIIKENNWDKDFDKISSLKEINFAKLFLINEKGYCLIHDILNMDYIVVNKNILTNDQNNFLHNYFKDMGNISEAEKYRVN